MITRSAHCFHDCMCILFLHDLSTSCVVDSRKPYICIYAHVYINNDVLKHMIYQLLTFSFVFHLIYLRVYLHVYLHIYISIYVSIYMFVTSHVPGLMSLMHHSFSWKIWAFCMSSIAHDLLYYAPCIACWAWSHCDGNQEGTLF